MVVKLKKLLKTARGLQIEPVNLLKQKMFGAKNKSYNSQHYTSTAPSTHNSKNEKRYTRLSRSNHNIDLTKNYNLIFQSPRLKIYILCLPRMI